MWRLVNFAVSEIGMAETLILIFAALLLFVYLRQAYLRREVSRVLRLGVWIPISVAIYSAFSSLLGAYETHGLLHSQDAINQAQRQLLFGQAHQGFVRVLALGCGCSLGLLYVVRTYERARRGRAAAPRRAISPLEGRN